MTTTYQLLTDKLNEAIAAEECDPSTKKLRDLFPNNWYDAEIEMNDTPPLALQAYIRNRWNAPTAIENAIKPVEPTDCFSGDQNESASFLVYSDGSLWYQNNAADEVWLDFEDFVTSDFASGLEAQNYHGDVSFDDLEDMDRGMLIRYAGSEEEAREYYETYCTPVGR